MATIGHVIPSEQRSVLLRIDDDVGRRSLRVLCKRWPTCTHAALSDDQEIEAYLVGYGHSACHMLVDLNARYSYVFDTAGGGKVVPIQDSVDYAYHMVGRESYFASYPTPATGPIDLPQPTASLPKVTPSIRRGEDGGMDDPTARMIAAMRGEGPVVDERDGNIHRIAGPGIMGVSWGETSLFDEAQKPENTPKRRRGRQTGTRDRSCGSWGRCEF